MSDPSIDEARPRPVIAGTGIKVSQVAHESTVLAWSEAEIHAAHPHLTLEQIRAAIEYSVQNPARIRAEWEESRRRIAEAEKRFPPQPERTQVNRGDEAARNERLARLRGLTPEEAFAIAVRAGIYTPEGELTEPYRDDASPSASRPND
jgi:uncharacterized protein (DUF433 family)